MQRSKTYDVARNWAANNCEVADKLPPEIKQVVHEYGVSVVRAFLDLGVKKPNHIRHLIHTVHLGPREFSNRPVKGDSSPILQQIDDILIRTGSGPIGKMFIGELWSSHTAALPLDGTKVGQILRQLAKHHSPWL